jgi:hypothetical protein
MTGYQGIYNFWKQLIMMNSPTQACSLDQTTTAAPYVALVVGSLYNLGSTPSFTADQYYNPILNASPTAVEGTDQALTTNTITNGLFKSTGGITFTAVAVGTAITALCIYRHNAGANTTWPLVYYVDSTAQGGMGLPVTPNGGNITIAWSGSGIFQL